MSKPKVMTEEERLIYKEKERERNREHYKKNKEYYAERNKKYYEKNIEYIKEYREQIKDEIAVKQREYREKNIEKIKQRDKNYYQNITKKQKQHRSFAGKYSGYKTKARSRGLCFELTKDDFKKFWQASCYYCGDEIETVGIDRIDSSVGYTVDNCRSCCIHCNTVKFNYSESETIAHIIKILKHQRILVENLLQDNFANDIVRQSSPTFAQSPL